MPIVRKRRRDKTEVSCIIKYLVFGFNVMFWLVGGFILAIGIWAWSEKDTFSNLSKLTNLALDPAFIFIIAGSVTFIIGFTGCVGALRENTCLLATYAFFLGGLLLSELTVGILGFIFKDWVKEQAVKSFETFIIHYRDDPDQQNLIDWVQGGWLKCCGVQTPNDWENNIYFNCSSKNLGSREACGVPFSCCKPKHNEMIENKQCGYDVRTNEYPGNMADVIFDRGCLEAAEKWLEGNLVIVAGVAVGIAVLQILGICFAQNLRADIFAQKSKWRC